jgi:hypothetical protein
MMKVICILALAAVALAVDGDFDGQVGYETKVELSKDGGIGHVKLPIAASDFPNNATLVKLFVRILVKGDALSAGGAAVDFFVGENSKADTTKTPWKQKEDKGSFPKMDYKVMAAPGAQTLYVTIRSNKCASCSSTTELKVGFFFVHFDDTKGVTEPPATEKANNYPSRDNSYTADYTVGLNKYGASASVDIQNFNLFVALDGQSAIAKTLLVISKAVPIQGTDDPKTKAQSATWQVIPGVAGASGNYRSGARFFENGIWYVTPFVTELSSPTAESTTFDFAIGYGHEPSAASLASPSIVALALACLVALKNLL